MKKYGNSHWKYKCQTKNLFDFQGLARILAFLQFLIAALLTASILPSSPSTRTLDACLGNYEQHFAKSSGFQVCTVGRSWQKIICQISVIIHSVFSSNVLEAIFLYKCFNTVKNQTEKSKKMIGDQAYNVRKRYVQCTLCTRYAMYKYIGIYLVISISHHTSANFITMLVTTASSNLAKIIL